MRRCSSLRPVWAFPLLGTVSLTTPSSTGLRDRTADILVHQVYRVDDVQFTENQGEPVFQLPTHLIEPVLRHIPHLLLERPEDAFAVLVDELLVGIFGASFAL